MPVPLRQLGDPLTAACSVNEEISSRTQFIKKNRQERNLGCKKRSPRESNTVGSLAFVSEIPHVCLLCRRFGTIYLITPLNFFTSFTGGALIHCSTLYRLHHRQCPDKEHKTEFSQTPSNSEIRLSNIDCQETHGASLTRDQGFIHAEVNKAGGRTWIAKEESMIFSTEINENVPTMSRLLVGLLSILAVQSYVESAGLVYDYYANSCPKAEEIIHDTVYKLYEKKGNIATSLIRFVFHDCFNGCDGSFLLESTQTMAAEKESPQQVGMRNQKYVNNIKAAVEAACPGVVSCADVLALGGAAGAQVLGGPAMKMKTGRRDSRVSVKAEADDGIPHPQSDVTTVLNYFSKLGISTEQTVALLGAHTIGRAHCVSFEERIYPTVDPKMDPVFANMLKYRCPQGTTVEPEPVHFTYFRNDEQSPMAFDNHYFVNLVANQGLLHIDSEIAWDARTKPYVEEYAKDNALWHKHFAEGFTILSEHNPLTGTDGEIRKHCSYAL